MVYVLSDIHGNERRFNSVLEQIGLGPRDRLYVLGDVIDRHPEGIRILRRLMGMSNAKLILGNHEYMMLRALGEPVDDNYDNGTAMAHWYRNGGGVTHAQWEILPDMYQRAILRFLKDLPLNREVQVNGRRYLLVHGAPETLWEKNEDPRYVSRAHFAVWKRLEQVPELPEDTTLIFGHTPTEYYQDHMPMEIYRGEGCIGIDCGGGYPEGGSGGRLACLRLDDGKVFYSEESDA